MSDFLQKLLICVIAAAVPVITTYVCDLIKTKSKEITERVANEKVQKTMVNVIDMIASVVECTNQVFVDGLKNRGEFTKESAANAFEQTKTKVRAMLTEDAAIIITDIYGDLDVFIDTQIEALVKQLKSCS